MTRRHVPPVLTGASVAAVALGVILLVGLAVGHWPFAFDRSIILGLRAWGGPAWLPKVAADVTALGGGIVLTIVVVIVAGLLLVQRLWLTAAAIVAASVSGNLVVELVKLQIGRPRPDIVAHLVTVKHMSFPSGHSANSAIVYLTLAGLASQVTADRATRAYLLVVAILLVGAIGCSRVYLGVHWPSDVLAGWSFGTLWALGWWLATARARESLGGER
ncbi:phosphatase PAP2 family protein [Sphingomonas ginsenosidivorax]|uniref:Phosphatase PAP2 family protein n=1 Tax=Sphingomonas ginsenosidivorax TaxID=862135 RepID=A0A5C6UGP4_9SPHN|nr:phosphatase PAP2 family protein [Sphingomonas ginsenosidivorax]TXC71923.1 phosphatase PAP2 family protein [Sphingomonas ginsenosidivorax]